MNTPLRILCADPSLGKIDKSSLSQQTLMELLIQDIENKGDIWDQSEHPTDISEWRDLAFNESGDLTRINWGPADLTGSIHLEWLPLTVTRVDIWNCFDDEDLLDGTLDLAHLPGTLQSLILSGNLYCGDIDLRTLPMGMQYLDLSFNMLSGRLELTSLPDGIQILNLQSNCFTGKTDLSALPASLHELDVSNNTDIEGTITLKTNDSFFCANKTKIHVLRKKSVDVI